MINLSTKRAVFYIACFLMQERAATKITSCSQNSSLHSWHIVMFLVYINITELELWSLKAMYEISFPIIFSYIMTQIYPLSLDFTICTWYTWTNHNFYKLLYRVDIKYYKHEDQIML